MKAELFIAQNNIESVRSIVEGAPDWATFYDVEIKDYSRGTVRTEIDVCLLELRRYIKSNDLVKQLKGLNRCKDLLVQCESFNCKRIAIQREPVCTYEELQSAVQDLELLLHWQSINKA